MRIYIPANTKLESPADSKQYRYKFASLAYYIPEHSNRLKLFHGLIKSDYFRDLWTAVNKGDDWELDCLLGLA
jgi:hypothetical protein